MENLPVLARPTGNVTEGLCPDCEERFMFEFKDEEKTFTMGASVILSALRALEERNELSMPDGWWEELDKYYSLQIKSQG